MLTFENSWNLTMRFSTKKLRKELGTVLALAVALLTATFVGAADSPRTKKDGARRLEAVERIDKRPTKCFALLVGVDQYENDLPELSYASSDALALKKTLLKIGFPEEGVQVFFTSPNLREHPTKAKIMKAFDQIIARADEESAIFVSFSGHGFETKDGMAAFCPMDVKADLSVEPPVVEKETAIVINDVADALRKSKARFKMLVVDACRETAKAKNVGGKEEEKRGFARPDATGLAFLQSCDSGQLSYEHPDFKGGVFTHYLIEGLEGKAATSDGGVSFLNVCSYVARKTKDFVDLKHKRRQTPFQEFKGVDFWLVEPKVGDGELLYRQGREALWGENGKNIDAAKAFQLLTQADVAEYFAARALLAEIRLSGAPGVEVDAADAFRLAQEPARRRDPWAYSVLGECYSKGLGVKRDEKKGDAYRRLAFAGFQKLAEAGDSAATDSLGCYYFNGCGTAKDDKKAAEFLTRAVNGGSVSAMDNLGGGYVYGYGVEQNVAKGLELLEKACARNSASAAGTLGRIYSSAYGNVPGVKKDDAKAIEYFRKGREGACSGAIYALASCYENGIGVEADEADAAKLYEEAAKGNDSGAITRIGQAYLYGNLGYKKDAKKAVEYLKRAANMDDVRGMRALATFYEGTGSKENKDRASLLKRRAAKIEARYAR